MARRNGRKGDFLQTSSYSGNTEYASKMVIDFWGDQGLKGEILKRNLQEIASPLGDPHPTNNRLGPQYETVNVSAVSNIPTFVGHTTKPFPKDSAYAQYLLYGRS